MRGLWVARWSACGGVPYGAHLLGVEEAEALRCGGAVQGVCCTGYPCGACPLFPVHSNGGGHAGVHPFGGLLDAAPRNASS